MTEKRNKAAQDNAGLNVDGMGMLGGQNAVQQSPVPGLPGIGNAPTHLGPMSKNFPYAGAASLGASAGAGNGAGNGEGPQNPYASSANISGAGLEDVQSSINQLNQSNQMAFPAVNKYAAQDNSKDQLSSTGEDNGVSFTTRDEDHATGPAAWDSLSKFMKTGDAGELPTLPGFRPEPTPPPAGAGLRMFPGFRNQPVLPARPAPPKKPLFPERVGGLLRGIERGSEKAFTGAARTLHDATKSRGGMVEMQGEDPGPEPEDDRPFIPIDPNTPLDDPSLFPPTDNDDLDKGGMDKYVKTGESLASSVDPKDLMKALAVLGVLGGTGGATFGGISNSLQGKSIGRGMLTGGLTGAGAGMGAGAGSLGGILGAEAAIDTGLIHPNLTGTAGILGGNVLAAGGGTGVGGYAGYQLAQKLMGLDEEDEKQGYEKVAQRALSKYLKPAAIAGGIGAAGIGTAVYVGKEMADPHPRKFDDTLNTLTPEGQEAIKNREPSVIADLADMFADVTGDHATDEEFSARTGHQRDSIDDQRRADKGYAVPAADLDPRSDGVGATALHMDRARQETLKQDAEAAGLTAKDDKPTADTGTDWLGDHWPQLAVGAGALGLGGYGLYKYLNRDKDDEHAEEEEDEDSYVDETKEAMSKYAKQPADQTPRHHCHGVHPDQTHEEWKASLEKGREKAAQRAVSKFLKPKKVPKRHARAPFSLPTNKHGLTNTQVGANVDNSATPEQLLGAHKATPWGSGAGRSTPSGSHVYAGSRQGIPRNLDAAKSIAHGSRRLGQFIGGAPNALSAEMSKAFGGKRPGGQLNKGGIDKYATRAVSKFLKPKKVPTPPKPPQWADGLKVDPNSKHIYRDADGKVRTYPSADADELHHKWMNDGTPKRYDQQTKKWRPADRWEQTEDKIGLVARLGALGGTGYMVGSALNRGNTSTPPDVAEMLKKYESQQRFGHAEQYGGDGERPGAWNDSPRDHGPYYNRDEWGRGIDWGSKVEGGFLGEKLPAPNIEKQNIDKYAQTPRHDCNAVHPDSTHEDWVREEFDNPPTRDWEREKGGSAGWWARAADLASIHIPQDAIKLLKEAGYAPFPCAFFGGLINSGLAGELLPNALEKAAGMVGDEFVAELRAVNISQMLEKVAVRAVTKVVKPPIPPKPPKTPKKTPKKTTPLKGGVGDEAPTGGAFDVPTTPKADTVKTPATGAVQGELPFGKAPTEAPTKATVKTPTTRQDPSSLQPQYVQKAPVLNAVTGKMESPGGLRLETKAEINTRVVNNTVGQWAKPDKPSVATQGTASQEIGSTRPQRAETPLQRSERILGELMDRQTYTTNRAQPRKQDTGEGSFDPREPFGPDPKLEPFGGEAAPRQPKPLDAAKPQNYEQPELAPLQPKPLDETIANPYVRQVNDALDPDARAAQEAAGFGDPGPTTRADALDPDARALDEAGFGDPGPTTRVPDDAPVPPVDPAAVPQPGGITRKVLGTTAGLGGGYLALDKILSNPASIKNLAELTGIPQTTVEALQNPDSFVSQMISLESPEEMMEFAMKSLGPDKIKAMALEQMGGEGGFDLLGGMGEGINKFTEAIGMDALLGMVMGPEAVANMSPILKLLMIAGGALGIGGAISGNTTAGMSGLAMFILPMVFGTLFGGAEAAKEKAPGAGEAAAAGGAAGGAAPKLNFKNIEGDVAPGAVDGNSVDPRTGLTVYQQAEQDGWKAPGYTTKQLVDALFEQRNSTGPNHAGPKLDAPAGPNAGPDQPAAPAAPEQPAAPTEKAKPKRVPMPTGDSGPPIPAMP
jgi:hypothetical protein